MKVQSIDQTKLMSADAEPLEVKTTSLTPREIGRETAVEIDIPLFQWLQYDRHYFRQYLLAQINWSLELLPVIQRHDSPFLYFYFRLFTFLGSEDFYWLVLPTIYWVFSPSVGRQFLCLWALCIFVGDWFKNVFCLPRPPSTLIKGSQKALDNHGFGWPSLHSIHAIALPLFAIRGRYGYVINWESYFVTSENTTLSTVLDLSGLELELELERELEVVHKGGILVCWFLALVWMNSVCLSRLYLGVHSPGDIQGGLIIGGVIFQFWSLFSEPFDHWLTTSSYGAFWVVFVGVLLLSLIPHVKVREFQPIALSETPGQQQQQPIIVRHSVSVTNEELVCVTMFMMGFLFWTNLFPDLLVPLAACQFSFYTVLVRMIVGCLNLAVIYLSISFLWKRYVEKSENTSPSPSPSSSLGLSSSSSSSSSSSTGGMNNHKNEEFTRMKILKTFVKYSIGCGSALVIFAPLSFSYLNI
eukprot:TRINITY_DN2803_c1_g2_i1.p1 TRINITY_DN2803_c1_g2~~TRINITY_DN2803_c1_g2_i1.p1  ORF type:complete len:470 (-),score=109.69 TRINITY_DN2803_c1_g2_i1:70-1479(-)